MPVSVTVVNAYDLGQPVTLDFQFYAGSTPAPPGTASLELRAPSGITTSPALTNLGAGAYTLTTTPDESGDWYWKLTGTAPVALKKEGRFYVRPSAFSNA